MLFNIKELASEIANEDKSIFQDLEDAGFSIFEYKPRENDYIPYLLKVAEDGNLDKFFKIAEGREEQIGWLFEPLTKEFIKDQLRTVKSGYNPLKQATARLNLLILASLDIEESKLAVLQTAAEKWKADKDAKKAKLLSRLEAKQKEVVKASK